MLVRLSKLFAVVSLLAAAFPAPSKAQVAVSGTYYEEVISAACYTKSCFVFFSAVPRNTLITKINCLVLSTTAMSDYQFAVSDTGTGFTVRRSEFLPVPTPVVNGGINYYSMLVPSNFLFGAGKFPALGVDLFAVGTTNWYCKITGTLQ
jgi:hypothetical protein